jgi:hypothetical protein
MSETCTVKVLDANGTPIQQALISLDDKQGTSDRNGVLDLTVSSNNVHSLRVTRYLYVAESIEFRGTLKDGEWNNALERKQSANQTLLTVRLGRLSLAPTALKSDAELKELISTGKGAGAAVLTTLPADPALKLPERRAYLDHGDTALAVSVAQKILLPEEPPPANSKGWEKVRTVSSNPPKVDPLSVGRFFWLLCRGPMDPRPADPEDLRPKRPKGGDVEFAIAVWSPHITREKPLDALDIAFYFSPNTGKYHSHYPFGFEKDNGTQEFMHLGTRYLLTQYCFATQLAAQGRQAVLIMPINNYADWGPTS